ncbi:hypothetical protein H4R26_003672 [Coemansia thaxteri]|uniref:Ion transport domain-containing protein n=1 Tax=Coemansia thaxteri TaxID=2663907 RepID=A0A9W8EIA9_9FUNG|nr:hypothetical protein H4R26_003672 [Coemansia thaxteri]KAJ2481143.1 hypothetical protein EV174_003548 [Coemansia sp. RSA 2320]
MARGPGNSNAGGYSEAARKSSDSLGFEEATFVTSPMSQTARFHAQSQPPKPAVAEVVSALQAPRFPVSAEPRAHTMPAASQSGSRHNALAIETPADSAVIDLNMPTKLVATGDREQQAEVHGGSGHGDGRAGGPGRDLTAQTAAAIAGTVSPPPAGVDEEQWYQEQINYVRTQVEHMEHMEEQRDQEAKSIRSKWKRELFLLFEDPSSSPSAFVINVFVTFMIIFSAVLTTIETIPTLRKGNSQMWLALELVIVAVFTLEFVLRFLGHTDSWRQAWNHAKSVVTIVDALAIFPFYIELLFHRDTSYEFRFTILRIFRLLRVFSAFKYSSLLQLSIEVMIVAIKRSSDALLAFLLFVALTVLLFSALMYFAERGTWDDERQAFLTSEGEYSKFSSIPAAAYYSIVTLTTTGFGDMVPKTFIGKLVSFPMMIAGILLIALPSIIVGRNFTQVWEAARKFRVQQRPNVRIQRIGETLVENDVGSDTRSSARVSRRSRRHQLRHRARGGTTMPANASGSNRRDGSVSSFESRSTRTTTKSPREIAGGYTNVYGGQRRHDGESSRGGVNDNDGYAHRADPIDDLARKDSFEMQQFAARPHGPEERPGGYAQVAGMADEDEDEGRRTNNASSSDEDDRNESASARRARLQHRRTGGGKGKGNDVESVRVQRVEWAALNAELSALRAAIGGHDQMLRAIASHLAVPNLPQSLPDKER